jgi:hypothetical protein
MNETPCRSNIPHKIRHLLQERVWTVLAATPRVSQPCLLRYFRILYGTQLWGTVSNSNIHILERFQSKVLRIITDAPWYMPSAVIKHDLQVPSVRQEVRTVSFTYHARLEGHSNDLATSLLQQPSHTRRPKRY